MEKTDHEERKLETIEHEERKREKRELSTARAEFDRNDIEYINV